MTSTGLMKLDAWVKARELANEVYKTILPLLPADEKYNLVAQIRRAATSIPANIAEGYGRYYYQSNIQFCYNARGSLEELISHLILTNDLGFLDEGSYKSTLYKANELVRLLNGYIAYLRKEKGGENETVLVKENLAQYEIEEKNIPADPINES